VISIPKIPNDAATRPAAMRNAQWFPVNLAIRVEKSAKDAGARVGEGIRIMGSLSVS